VILIFPSRVGDLAFKELRDEFLEMLGCKRLGGCMKCWRFSCRVTFLEGNRDVVDLLQLNCSPADAFPETSFSCIVDWRRKAVKVLKYIRVDNLGQQNRLCLFFLLYRRKHL